VNAHFVGSIVYVEQGLYQIVNQAPLLVIDGQQRLTTVMLLIEALARAVGEHEPLDDFSARKKTCFHDIRELRFEVSYPFLLKLYEDHTKGVLSKADFGATTRLVEAYVFRRAVCGIPTNSLNKTFSKFSESLREGSYLESIKANFLTMPSYRRFPKDDEFERAFQTKDLYTFRNRSYWLRRLENEGRKERVAVQNYTVEHIMPQTENLRLEWRIALGADWKRVQAEWLHRPGNLTLTGYNSEYSDRPFVDKRDINGGFRASPLQMNEGLGQLEAWDEAAIKTRGRAPRCNGCQGMGRSPASGDDP
jgi:hypothetical protein